MIRAAIFSDLIVIIGVAKSVDGELSELTKLFFVPLSLEVAVTNDGNAPGIRVSSAITIENNLELVGGLAD